MKNNWPVKKLGEIANVYGGGTPPTSHTEYFKGDINWFTPTELPIDSVGTISESNRKISEDARKFTTISGAGTVVLSSRATIGNVAILSTASGYNQGIKGIEPKQDEIDNWYIGYWLKANKDTLLLKSFGTTFKEISTSAVKDLEIQIPPKNSQKKIVERLDAIRKAQDFCDQQIQKTEELFESLLNTFYSQEVGSFGKIKDGATLKGGYAFKSEDFIYEGIQIIKMGNVKRNSIDLSASPTFLPKEFVNKYPNYMLRHGDIVISMTGTVGKEDYGNVAIIEKNQTFLLNQRVGKFVINSDVFKSIYLYYFCQTKDFRKQVFSLGKGVRQANISASQIESIKIPMLMIKEQQRIVEKLEAVQNYKKLLIKQKGLLKELFESVLDKSMKGKLDA